ncbi:hypothetical protein AQUCO_00800200v1 [Aquilegia coerulea]|uniref:Pentacotripeptide-repeat region of PRORP domain-containing protein n=1 Tax=Aquilegia coerulea TaxID=218851 RepID=A0A2G5EI91_AQUCA|nr:hypothetical protein AQUCO_00800200v1 [Aquilegia coerulea]
MGQMRKLGLVNSTDAYNLMLNFYANVGQYENLDKLLVEMNVKRVRPDKATFGICLTAYEATSDINGMEKILHTIDTNPDIVLDWTLYTTAGNTYINAGLIDKALEMLKKSEELIPRHKRRSAYDSLIKLYASIGRKDDLYRIWNLYKSSGKVFSIAYHCMIASLLKVDDIVGAEKILEEWESSNVLHNFKDPNSLAPAYLENDLLEKAIKKGLKPCRTTFEILATGYIASNQMPKAIDSLKEAFLLRRSGWKPIRDTLAACLIYMKQQGDAEKREEFVKLLGIPSHMLTDDWEKLLDYFFDSKADVLK